MEVLREGTPKITLFSRFLRFRPYYATKIPQIQCYARSKAVYEPL
jgi:hypothetical protein